MEGTLRSPLRAVSTAMHRPDPIVSARPLAYKSGVIVSARNEFGCGFATELRPSWSTVEFAADLVYLRLHSSTYDTDALTPLELEYDLRDVLPRGICFSAAHELGLKGWRQTDVTFEMRRPPKASVQVNSVLRRMTERDTQLDGGYELDDQARGETVFKGLAAHGEESALRASTIILLYKPR